MIKLKPKVLCFLSDNAKKELNHFDESTLMKEKELKHWVKEHGFVLEQSCEPWLIIQQKEINSRIQSKTVLQVKIGR